MKTVRMPQLRSVMVVPGDSYPAASSSSQWSTTKIMGRLWVFASFSLLS
jgi:hypothetical protein